MPQKTAYVTGGASGIGRAVAELLVSRGVRVAIADINLEGAKATADSLGPRSRNNNNEQTADDTTVTAYELNAADWDSQVSVFEKVVKEFGRIDYVYPIAGIGEKISIPNDPAAKGFIKPDMSVLDVDLYGFIYSTSLAIQQMRRQEKDEQGFRGKSAQAVLALVRWE